MIRKYKESDVDAVVASWRAASELAHPFLTKAFLDEEEGNVRNVYLKIAETWVTEVDGDVVGFIALVDDEIGGLFLDPDYHGRGLGKDMVDRAVAEKGAMTVEVFKLNSIGRRFYNAYGFEYTDEGLHDPTGQIIVRMSFAPR